MLSPLACPTVLPRVPSLRQDTPCIPQCPDVEREPAVAPTPEDLLADRVYSHVALQAWDMYRSLAPQFRPPAFYDRPLEVWAPLLSEHEVEWLPALQRQRALVIRAQPDAIVARRNYPDEAAAAASPSPAQDQELDDFTSPGSRPPAFWNRPFARLKAIGDEEIAVLPYKFRFDPSVIGELIKGFWGPREFVLRDVNHSAFALDVLDDLWDELSVLAASDDPALRSRHLVLRELEDRQRQRNVAELRATGLLRWPRLVFPPHLDLSVYRAFMSVDGLLALYVRPDPSRNEVDSRAYSDEMRLLQEQWWFCV